MEYENSITNFSTENAEYVLVLGSPAEERQNLEVLIEQSFKNINALVFGYGEVLERLTKKKFENYLNNNRFYHCIINLCKNKKIPIFKLDYELRKGAIYPDYDGSNAVSAEKIEEFVTKKIKKKVKKKPRIGLIFNSKHIYLKSYLKSQYDRKKTINEYQDHEIGDTRLDNPKINIVYEANFSKIWISWKVKECNPSLIKNVPPPSRRHYYFFE